MVRCGRVAAMSIRIDTLGVTRRNDAALTARKKYNAVIFFVLRTSLSGFAPAKKVANALSPFSDGKLAFFKILLPLPDEIKVMGWLLR